MKIHVAFAATALIALASAAPAVLAQQDPIATRKAIMKKNGEHAKLGAKMVKSEEPFDLEKAKTIFVVFQQAADEVPNLFPVDSKTGGETEALPKIWEDMADFKAKFAKFGADAKAAQASVTDFDSFKASFGAVMKNCGGCHELYRVKKNG